jgi:hypothetical protein
MTSTQYTVHKTYKWLRLRQPHPQAQASVNQ